MILQIYTDGGSLNNPGQAAYSYVIYKDFVKIFSHSERIGIATNNIAEYTALIKALEKVKDLINSHKYQITKINVFSDSSLMVNQIKGLFKVKDAKIRECVFKIRFLEGEINLPIIYIHILREKNMLADSLVKKVLQSH